MRGLLAFLLIVMLITLTPASAEVVDPPLESSIPMRAGVYLKIHIIGYDEEGVMVVRGKDSRHKVRWNEIQTRGIFALHERFLRKGTGEQWLQAGRILLTLPDGATYADRAFARAVRIDPSLKPDVDAARNGGTADPVSTTRSPATPSPVAATAPSSRPTTTSSWGKQTDEEMAARVKTLKLEGARLQRLTTARLELYETQYFLFYSNLPRSEAQKWSGVLDRMYTRLVEMFDLPAGENIWYGKAMITVFLSRDDYLKFEKAAYRSDRAEKHAGYCHQWEDGRVHIVFYRAPSDLDFARLLVHEATHGFVHRYRSPARLPTWAGEGLAEVLAFELVPHAGLKQSADAHAKSELRRPKPLEKLFGDDGHIDGFQYPIARTLCEFMIRQNQRGYVSFINGIKDGMRWQDALQREYGVSMDRLIEAYGASMGVPGLQAE